MSNDKQSEVASRPPLSDKDLLLVLTAAVTALMLTRPEFEHSKMILVPDPRDPKHLLALHTGPAGTHILSDEEFAMVRDEMLCEDCQAQLRPYAIIHTGVNLNNGQFNPGAYLGLEGGHAGQKFTHEEEIEDLLSSEAIELDDDEDEEIDPNDLSPKRTLN